MRKKVHIKKLINYSKMSIRSVNLNNWSY